MISFIKTKSFVFLSEATKAKASFVRKQVLAKGLNNEKI